MRVGNDRAKRNALLHSVRAVLDAGPASLDRHFEEIAARHQVSLNEVCTAYLDEWMARLRSQKSHPEVVLDEPTERGMAECLLRYLPPPVAFVSEKDAFFVFDGQIWQQDVRGVLHRFVGMLAKTLRQKAALTQNETEAQKLRQAASNLGRRSVAENVLRIMTTFPGITKPLASFNTSDTLLPVKNGVVDLRSGNFLAYDPEMRFTHKVPVSYNPDAPCTLWLKFLREIICDEEIIEFLQRFFGYALTGYIIEQVFLILAGGGNNGKSTLCNSIRSILGMFAFTTEFSTFVIQRSDKVRNDIAAMVGSRVVFASEPQAGSVLNESLIKQLTGGEPVSARFLNREYFEFKPRFKIISSVNTMPRITGTNQGIWRRVLVVPCTTEIPEEKVDRNLEEKLRGEAEGILAWAVAGAVKYFQRGLEVPECIRAASKSYRRAEDFVAIFLEEKCVVGANQEAKVGALNQSFLNWLKAEGIEDLGPRDLRERLERMGLSQRHTKAARFWQGIGIKGGWQCK